MTESQRAVVAQLHEDEPDRRTSSAKRRRQRMRDLGICINASLVIALQPSRVTRPPRVEHGPPVPGAKHGKCQRCVEIHAKSRDNWKKPRATDPYLAEAEAEAA